MATAQLITRDNFAGLLKRSTQPRTGTPDGNIYFDTTNDVIELITREELPQIDLGSGLDDNPLTNADKIQSLALYFFGLQEVEADPALQKFRDFMDAAPNRLGKLTGATSFLNGVKLATGGDLGDDRLKVASSGATEFAAGGGGNTLIDRILHGAKSLNPIEATSQPFYQISASLSEADRQAAAPVDFSKPGDIDEFIQTFGSTANGDAGAGDFDSLNSVLILGVRSYGFTVSETNSEATGVSELGAYQQGYGLGETAVQAVAAITEADVFGAEQAAPFTGLSFERVAVPEVIGGFNEADASFTDIIRNTGGANLIQVRAWLDKLMQQDTDQNALTGSTGPFIPKRAEPLYTISATGKLITRQGLGIEGIPTIDQQDLIQTDDSGATKTYPFFPEVVVRLSSSWFNDASGQWFRGMFSDGPAADDDFDTDGAITVLDSGAAAIAGDKTDARITPVNAGEYYELKFSFPYDTDTLGGGAGTDKTMVFQCGGVSTSKRRTISVPLTRSAQIPADASTDAETN